MENLYEISSSSWRQRMKQRGHVWTGVSRCLGTETRKTDRNMSTETAGEAVTLTKRSPPGERLFVDMINGPQQTGTIQGEEGYLAPS